MDGEEAVSSIDRASATNTHDVLKLAERDLSDYCTGLYEEDETERCWLAYQYFEEKKEAAEGGCDIEVKDGVVNGIDCQRMEQFEDFVRQMVKEGHVRNMAKTLATLAGAERRKSTRREAGDPVSLGTIVDDIDAQAPEEETPAKDALRSVLADVFNEHDANSDGRLDVQEFRAAMTSMGDDLSAKTVSTIFQAMDVHGWINFDQFVSIVEAEEVRAHSRFAKALRGMARNSSRWWTEMPAGVDSLL